MMPSFQGNMLAAFAGRGPGMNQMQPYLGGMGQAQQGPYQYSQAYSNMPQPQQMQFPQQPMGGMGGISPQQLQAIQQAFAQRMQQSPPPVPSAMGMGGAAPQMPQPVAAAAPAMGGMGQPWFQRVGRRAL